MKIENEYPFLLSLFWEESKGQDCCRCLNPLNKKEAMLFSIDTGDSFCLECGLKIMNEQKAYIDSFIVLVESLNKVFSKKENVE